MSLIWDIVQSVERRAAMPLPQHRGSISSRRELIFSAGSEILPQQDKQQHRTNSADDVTGYKEQTRLTDPDTAASASDESHKQHIVEKQKTDGLQELVKGSSGSDGPMQQESASFQVSQLATSDMQVSSKSSKAGKQQGKKNRNMKRSMQTQQVTGAEDTVTSSETRAGNTSASIITDEPIVAGSTTPDDVDDVVNPN